MGESAMTSALVSIALYLFGASASAALLCYLGLLLRGPPRAPPASLPRLPGEDELETVDPRTGDTVAVSCPEGGGDGNLVDLGLVVPAYKETARLPAMLAETYEYLLARRKRAEKGGVASSFTFEVLIVDDGSNDGTSEAALAYAAEHLSPGDRPTLRVLRLRRNRGKGGAVRMGVLSSRGRLILMVDADAATRIDDVEDLEAGISGSGAAVAIGSRARADAEEEAATAKRSPIRKFLMMGFKLVVYILGGLRGIKDSQCGFKLFKRSAAIDIFSNLHSERWVFDVEVLYLAQQYRVGVAEVPVNWHEVGGGTLSPGLAAVQMAKDLLLMRLMFMSGLWKIKNSPTS